MSKYVFIGADKSNGWRTGKIYPVRLDRNEDPSDWFIAVSPDRKPWDLRMFRDGDVTFYDSDELFNKNWKPAPHNDKAGK